MPFPSSACQTCKIRRIKCDETKPSCRRCIKSGRICLETSVVKQASFSINIENAYASGKTKRPRGPRSSLTVFRPQFDLQTRAIAYYVQYHLTLGLDIPIASGCMPDCLSIWQDFRSRSTMVDLGLSCMALALYSRIQQHPLASSEASTKYFLLLKIVQERIHQLGEDEKNIDACLLAIFLMGRYESTTYYPDNASRETSDSKSLSRDTLVSQRIWSHHDGAQAILEFWNDKIDRHPTAATFVMKQTRRRLIKSALLRIRPLPDWLSNGSRFGEYGLELEYDHISIRLANLRYAIASLQQDDVQIDNFEELDNEAREVDKALQDWAEQIFHLYPYHIHILAESDVKEYFYSSMVYSYSRPADAAIWSQYFALRMVISHTRLRLLKWSDPWIDQRQQRLECITQLEDMADNLTATIPFCLEQFRVDAPNPPTGQSSIILNTDEGIKPYLANLLIWQLTIASSLKGIQYRQQSWLKSTLAQIGRIIGDGIIECAGTDKWAVTG